jgi:excisionase family DNA binding protein
MNLADAIRQAALRQAEEQGTPAQANPTQGNPVQGSPAQGNQEQTMPNPSNDPSPKAAKASRAGKGQKAPAAQPAPKLDNEAIEAVVPNWGSDTGKLTIQAGPNEAAQLFATDSGTGELVDMPDSNATFGGGNAVRFEIFLSPDQLSCLFRALVATQHSMLTMREAANYLRIPASTLEQLAAESKIPALQIDGRWRFPKSGIDEWVMLQSFKDGEVSDAA